MILLKRTFIYKLMLIAISLAFSVSAISSDRSNSTAVDKIRILAEQGDVKYESILGIIYYNGDHGVTQDYSQAAKWLERAATQGEINSQSLLGIMYLKGRGVSQDYSQAIKWLEKSAQQNDSQAQLVLGSIYYIGEGGSQNISQDLKIAKEWFKTSCSNGSERGCELYQSPKLEGY